MSLIHDSTTLQAAGESSAKETQSRAKISQLMHDALLEGPESLGPLCESLRSMPTAALKQELECLAVYLKGVANDAPQLESFSLRNKLSQAPAVICELGHQLSMREQESFPEISQKFYLSAHTLARKNSDLVGQLNAIALILQKEQDPQFRASMLAETEKIKVSFDKSEAKILPGFFRIFRGEVQLLPGVGIEALKDKCSTIINFYARNTAQCTQLFSTLGPDAAEVKISDLRKFDSPLVIFHAMIDIAKIAQSANLRKNADRALMLLSGTLGTVTHRSWLREEEQASFSIADLLFAVVKHQQLRNDMLRFVAACNKNPQSPEAANLLPKFTDPIRFGLPQFAGRSFGFAGSKDIFPLLGFNRNAILADFYSARAMACHQSLNLAAEKVLADLILATKHRALAVIGGFLSAEVDPLKTACGEYQERALEHLNRNHKGPFIGREKKPGGDRPTYGRGKERERRRSEEDEESA